VRKSRTFGPLQVFSGAKTGAVRTNEFPLFPAVKRMVGHKSAAAVAGIGHKTPREFWCGDPSGEVASFADDVCST